MYCVFVCVYPCTVRVCLCVCSLVSACSLMASSLLGKPANFLEWVVSMCVGMLQHRDHDVRKSLSEGELVAGVQRYFLASFTQMWVADLMELPPSQRVCFTVYCLHSWCELGITLEQLWWRVDACQTTFLLLRDQPVVLLLLTLWASWRPSNRSLCLCCK